MMDGSNDNMLVAQIMNDLGYPEIAKDIQSSFGALLNEYKSLAIVLSSYKQDAMALEQLTMAGMVY